MMCVCFNNVVSSKTKKLVDGRATLPKKFTDIEIVCKVSHQEMLMMHMCTAYCTCSKTKIPNFTRYDNYCAFPTSTISPLIFPF